MTLTDHMRNKIKIRLKAMSNDERLAMLKRMLDHRDRCPVDDRGFITTSVDPDRELLEAGRDYIIHLLQFDKHYRPEPLHEFKTVFISTPRGDLSPWKTMFDRAVSIEMRHDMIALRQNGKYDTTCALVANKYLQRDGDIDHMRLPGLLSDLRNTQIGGGA